MHPFARRLYAGLTGAALILATAVVSQGSTSPPTPVVDRIDPAVWADLDSGGSADFWVYFSARPDLSAAASMPDWEARGQFVYDALTANAEASQAGARAELDAAGISYEAFSITNAILVSDGDRALATSLVAEPGVEGIYPDEEVTPPAPERIVPEPAGAEGPMAPAAVEWGLADINADDVWARGFTGQGIVVASIDTGVEWDHPALVNQYRGNSGGAADHNYNWFDVAQRSPDFPADTDGHGTHTTGTIVGTDGEANQIGVAPGARWIAANGCCRTIAGLIASGEWTLAPTDLTGSHPAPALRPHIINNSWGTTGPSTSPFLDDVSRAWAASGQFAVFSNGNEGPGCQTSTAPGSRTLNYSVGNYASDHTLATLSSRGAGQGGTVKPDISAPGTDVRSSYLGGTYATGSGTSMAAPHVAGTVALLWSARPELLGNVEGTRALLDDTAIDTEGTDCGGTAADNNMFGEGRLDALALLDREPQVHRLSGSHRYATAVAVSQAAHPDGAGTVYLATGADYPDALVGAALAGSRDAPVLLTRPDGIPSGTQAELTRLSPDQIYLFGGEGAISETVRTQAGELTGATVTRLAGEHRYATAGIIAEEFTTAEVVYVATGQNFPDALAGAARAGALDGPVLLTRPDLLPNATQEQLARLQPDQIRVLGGTGAISSSVETQLETYAPVTRISGANRYATAAQVSQDYSGAETVFVATGMDWPDALAGAAAAGSEHAPVLLVQQGSLPGVTRSELERLSPQTVFVLGGTGAIGDGVANELLVLP